MSESPRDLPPDLVLPLATGEPWWYFIGGRPSVDFANTLRERWWRQVETLVSSRDLAQWLHRAGVVQVPLAPTPAMLRAARELRETIDNVFTRTIAGLPPDGSDVAAINRWLCSAQRPPQLALESSGLTLRESDAGNPVRHALGLLALDAAQIIGDAEHRARLRVCASDTCSARFFDNSPAGRRQWCSMNACGNVAKARRYRARHGHPATTRGGHGG